MVIMTCGDDEGRTYIATTNPTEVAGVQLSRKTQRANADLQTKGTPTNAGISAGAEARGAPTAVGSGVDIAQWTGADNTICYREPLVWPSGANKQPELLIKGWTDVSTRIDPCGEPKISCNLVI